MSPNSSVDTTLLGEFDRGVKGMLAADCICRVRCEGDMKGASTDPNSRAALYGAAVPGAMSHQETEGSASALKTRVCECKDSRLLIVTSESRADNELT